MKEGNTEIHNSRDIVLYILIVLTFATKLKMPNELFPFLGIKTLNAFLESEGVLLTFRISKTLNEI